MKCSACGFSNTDGVKYCGECGARLQTAAGDALSEPSAGANEQQSFDDMSVIRKFLTPQLSEMILAARGRIEGERRQVTPLFVDIKGYTPLSEALGEEATYRVMERVYECMITAVTQEEGTVQELTGDGIFALFGAPIALEDAPLRACRAALEMQKRMRSLGDELHASHGIRPQARIGINTGPVVVGTVGTDLRMEFKAIGDTVNLASRLESIAEPGRVFISEATHSLVASLVNCTFVGEREIKGKSELQKIYRLEGIKEHAVRFNGALQHGLTPLAGRAEELDLLARYCDESGRNAILLVLVSGEAGVGKSRLVYELSRRIQGKRILFLRTNCTSYGRSTSFLPFIEMVRNLLNIHDDDGQQVVERKIRLGLELVGMQGVDAEPFLLALMGFDVKSAALKGLDARLISDRTKEVLVSLLRNRCRLSHLVLVIEDLHWIDQASENLLGRIIQEEERIPLFILCTARPSYESPYAGFANFKVLRLEPLSRASTVGLVQGLLGCDALDEDLARAIMEKSGGNPLYAEEVTRYLLESGSIKRTERAASCNLVAGKSVIPATVMDILQSRIDHLEDGPKTLLQAAAVIGQRFSPELARLVSGLGNSFDRYLHDLEKLGLIFTERGEEGLECRFQHTLLQDVVYDSLLKPRKEKLHQLVGEALEEMFRDRLNEWAEILAYHWGNTQNAGKAVLYMAMAGKKNYRAWALAEAHQLFDLAVELIQAAPGCVEEAFFADLINNWSLVFFYRADFKGLREMLERYLPRIEALGDKRRLSLILSWLAEAENFSGNGKKARPLLERAESLADEIGDAECKAYVSRGFLWFYAYWMPDSKLADAMVEHYFKVAVENGELLEDVFILLHAYLCKAIHTNLRTRFSETRYCCSQLMELGRRFRDNRSLSTAQWSLGFCNGLEERCEEALENAEQSLCLSPDRLDELCALGAKGGALALMGRAQEGLELIRQVRNDYIQNQFILPLAGIDMPYGAVMVLAGEMKKGVKHIHDASKYWASLGNYTQPTVGHYYLADIYLRMCTGTVRPGLRVILKNLWFLVRTLPVAEKKARFHLQVSENKAREYNMPGILARALYGLGLLAQKKKQFDVARSYFGEALKVAEESGLYIAEDVRSALQALG